MVKTKLLKLAMLILLMGIMVIGYGGFCTVTVGTKSGSSAPAEKSVISGQAYQQTSDNNMVPLGGATVTVTDASNMHERLGALDPFTSGSIETFPRFGYGAKISRNKITFSWNKSGNEQLDKEIAAKVYENIARSGVGIKSISGSQNYGFLDHPLRSLVSNWCDKNILSSEMLPKSLELVTAMAILLQRLEAGAGSEELRQAVDIAEGAIGPAMLECVRAKNVEILSDISTARLFLSCVRERVEQIESQEVAGGFAGHHLWSSVYKWCHHSSYEPFSGTQMSDLQRFATAMSELFVQLRIEAEPAYLHQAINSASEAIEAARNECVRAQKTDDLLAIAKAEQFLDYVRLECESFKPNTLKPPEVAASSPRVKGPLGIV